MICRADKKIFARKIIRKFGGVKSEDIANEVRANTKLCQPNCHNNIVEVFGCGWMPPPNASYFFIDMEYCETDLEQHINNSIRADASDLSQITDSSSFADALQILDDVTCGLEFIHEHDEVHRDLKPKNGRHDPNDVAGSTNQYRSVIFIQMSVLENCRFWPEYRSDLKIFSRHHIFTRNS